MPLSLFPKQGCVGLDIGHNSIKAVQLERSGDMWVVQKAAEAPTPADAVKDGVVIDQAAMTEAIRAVLREGRFNAQSAN
ncbi:MAG: pilus assembly protein PilM, partial [Fimbriimonadales bacterium]